MKELIGKVISELKVSKDDQSFLAFYHPDGTCTSYDAVGDCCSETWFADITGVDCLLGHTVLSVEEMEMPDFDEDTDKRSRQEYDDIYGIKIITDKGYVDIVFRNSSNGYYGGWLELNKRELPEMVSITDDWSA